MRVLFCADIDAGRAKAQAAAYGVPASGSAGAGPRAPGVQLIVNLTIPAAHAEVASAAIAAGKHVWNEKPLAPDVAAGRALLDQARTRRGAGRLRAGHHARRRHPVGPAADRRGRDRHAAQRAHPAAGPGARVVAPGPGVPVREGRGAAVRPRAVLPVGAGDAVRADDPGGRGQPPGARHPGRSAPARGRARSSTWRCPPTYRPLAEYAGGQAASLLFSWDSPLPPDGLPRDHRDRGHPRGARPEPVRRRPAGAPGGRAGVDRDRLGRRRGRARQRRGRHGPRRSGAASRTGPRARWRCTCWR